MENGIKILATAFTFLTLSFSPFLAGLAAIILLLDDIAVFRAGGDSIIGELVKAFEDLPNLADVFAGDADIVGIMDGITNAMILMTTAAIALANPLVAIVGALTFLSKAPQFGRFIAEKIDKTESGQGIGNFLLRSKEFLGELLGANRKALSTGFRKPEFSSSGIVNNNNINITGLSPQETGQEVQRSLRIINQESLNRVQASQGNGIK